MSKKDIIIKNIKNTPIEVSEWIIKLNYFSNTDQFHNQIKREKLDINHRLFHEPLIDCNKLGSSGVDYYWQKRNQEPFKLIKLYLKAHIFLRKSIANDLKRVDEFLRKYNLCLFLKSGYRHPVLQEAAIKYFKKTTYFSRFANKQSISRQHPYPHSTGAALDGTCQNPCGCF